jgi:hypothetical protein
VELFGRLADREAAVNFEYGSSAGFADVDFHGEPVSHGSASIYSFGVAAAIGEAGRHYTLAGKLHKGNHCRSLQAELSRGQRGAAHQKNKSWTCKFQTAAGGGDAYNAGDELAGPR